MTYKEFDQLKIGDQVGYKIRKSQSKLATGEIVYIHNETRKVVVVTDSSTYNGQTGEFDPIKDIEIWSYMFMKKID